MTIETREQLHEALAQLPDRDLQHEWWIELAWEVWQGKIAKLGDDYPLTDISRSYFEGMMNDYRAGGGRWSDSRF